MRLRSLFTGFCLLSTLLSTPALATSWVKIGGTPTLVLYQAPATQRQLENTQKIWEMQDLLQRDPDGVLSRRYLNEYDCSTRYHRIGKMTSHSGPQLSGSVLFEVEEMGYWRKIPANSLFALGYIAVCG